jgi:hypothetical protein
MFAALVCRSAGTDDVELRYKFKEGQKLNYVTDQTMKMEMNVAGNDISMDMAMKMNMVWKVESVDKDGNAKVTQTISWLKMSMTHPAGKFEYDSKDDKDPDDPVAKKALPAIKALVGAEISMTVDHRGKVSDLKVPDKLKEAWKKAGQNQALGDLGSEEGIKKMAEQFSVVLPEGAVAKGKSWDSKSELNMPQFGKMLTEAKFTFDGMEKKDGRTLAKLPFEVTQKIEPAKDSPVEMKVKSQESKGTTYFDVEAGRMVETKMEQDIVMEISAKGQSFTQKIKQTLNLKLDNSK